MASEFPLDPRYTVQASSTIAASECDWCGRAVRPETARVRVEQRDDGVEIVTLCSECEFGTD